LFTSCHILQSSAPCQRSRKIQHSNRTHACPFSCPYCVRVLCCDVPSRSCESSHRGQRRLVREMQRSSCPFSVSIRRRRAGCPPPPSQGKLFSLPALSPGKNGAWHPSLPTPRNGPGFLPTGCAEGCQAWDRGSQAHQSPGAAAVLAMHGIVWLLVACCNDPNPPNTFLVHYSRTSPRKSFF